MKIRGQSTIEFTFVLIVIFFLTYGLIRAFRWAGMDLAERRWTQDHTLTNCQGDQTPCLSSDFYRPKRIGGVFRGAAQ